MTSKNAFVAAVSGYEIRGRLKSNQGTCLMSEQARLIDRIRGVMYGQAIGDALGLGTEFLSKKQVELLYPLKLCEYSQIIADSHRENWQPGEWTDDTDQMLCILDSLVAKEGVDVRDIAARIHGWAMQGGRGLGRTVLNVLSEHDFLQDPHAASRRVWERSGCRPAANGAVMRTSIMGVWNYLHADSACDDTAAVCRITHFDPRCVASCVAVSLAISGLLGGRSDVACLIEEIKHSVQEIDARICDCFILSGSGSIAELRLDEGLNPGEPDRIGYTFKSTAAAFWALRHCDSVESGIAAVIHEGGDADTNAAVAGAILGARFGYGSIRSGLVDSLAGNNSLFERCERLTRVLGLS